MNPNKLGALLIAAVLMAITGIVVTLTVMKRNHVAVHPQTSCPTGANSRYPSTVILIDRSDPLL